MCRVASSNSPSPQVSTDTRLKQLGLAILGVVVIALAFAAFFSRYCWRGAVLPPMSYRTSAFVTFSLIGGTCLIGAVALSLFPPAPKK